jgi:hypothetical protein
MRDESYEAYWAMSQHVLAILRHAPLGYFLSINSEPRLNRRPVTRTLVLLIARWLNRKYLRLNLIEVSTERSTTQ